MSTELEMLQVLDRGLKSYSGKRALYHEFPALFTPRPKWIRKAVLPEICQFTMFEILGAVSLVSQISVLDLCSHRRFMPLVRARYVFMWLARHHTHHSLPRIGQYVRKDHSTILHGLRRVEHDWPDFVEMIEDAKSALAERLEAKQS